MLGKIEGKKRRGRVEDEMVRQHHQFNGHEFEQTLGDREGQGSLVCCSPWVARSWIWLSAWTTTKIRQLPLQTLNQNLGFNENPQVICKLKVWEALPTLFNYLSLPSQWYTILKWFAGQWNTDVWDLREKIIVNYLALSVIIVGKTYHLDFLETLIFFLVSHK